MKNLGQDSQSPDQDLDQTWSWGITHTSAILGLKTRVTCRIRKYSFPQQWKFVGKTRERALFSMWCEEVVQAEY
jgi:hypothetical protein